MPIKIPEGLPAEKILENEKIFVMPESRALHQDIRPLRIAVLNLMPTKIVTETQLVRILSNTSLQVELTLLFLSSHTPKNTSSEHMDHFYTRFGDVKDQKFDGLIITGAPVEKIDFTDVRYWDELCEIFAWCKTNVFSTIHICWAAMAGLHYHYGIPKYALDKKLSGVYSHRVMTPHHPLLRGFDEEFFVPHSRYTEVHEDDILKTGKLEILAKSDEAGVYLVSDRHARKFFVTGHPEYDFDTLANEYFRDINKGLSIDIPAHYFPGNNPQNRPLNRWKSAAQLLFSNWLNYFVYQMTPFDLNELKEV
ncbi:MAG: homoserine O-succinyltransferase [Ruminococcaceae bacterium]|nr:homoserine O-succinyltransferase [Oscillospiraceae bacterium]